MIHIARATRGRYTEPVPVESVKMCFVDENDNACDPPVKYPCEHPNHWIWGPGTRNGQKLYYELTKMFIQKYELTQQELNDAVRAYDMFSLEINGRIICPNCAAHEKTRQGIGGSKSLGQKALRPQPPSFNASVKIPGGGINE